MVVISDVDLIRQAMLGKNSEPTSGRASNFIASIFSNGKHGILSSDGPVWRANRRFALRTLRDFGFGRNLMEVKVQKQCEWFMARLSEVSGERDYSPDDDIHMAVGGLSRQMYS